MENTYKTIVATATGQFKDRGSRFIGFLYPVSDEEEIKAHLAALKKEYHDATHYCYAYTIGHTGPAQTRTMTTVNLPAARHAPFSGSCSPPDFPMCWRLWCAISAAPSSACPG